MRDLWLYDRLAADVIDRELLGELAELAAQRHTVRAPFLARLHPHATHEDPELRATIVACFAGVEGYEGLRVIVRALNDEIAEVRDAAVTALLKTGARANLRLAHGLFHHRPDVRARVVAESSVPGALAAHLFADPASRDIVVERAAELIHGGDGVETIVMLYTTGVVPREVIRAGLLALEWDERTQPLLEGLPIGVLPLLPKDRAALDGSLQAESNDRFDVVLRLVGDDPGFVERFVRGAKRRSVQGAQGLRIAWAIARVVASFEDPPPEMIALSAAHLPMLLAHPVLEVGVAKAAARRIADLRPKADLEDPLAEVFGAPVCLDGSMLDLDVISGILMLSKPPPIVSIATYGTIAEWEAAIRANPRAGVPLLAQTPPSKHAKLFRELVGALLVSPRRDAELVLDVVATVSNVRSELFFLEEAASRDRDLVWLLVQTAMRRERDGSFVLSNVQRSRLVTWLAARLDAAQLDTLMIHVATRAEVEGQTMADEIVCAASRARGEGVADRVAAFAVEHQRAVLMWTRRFAHFPSEVFFAIAGRLAASPDAEVRALAQIVQAPPSPEMRMNEERTDVRALTEEETDAILAADSADLFSALRVVYTQPVRGVARALLDRKEAAPSPRIAAAILFGFDDPVLTSRAFTRYTEDDETFWSTLETEMVDRGRRAPFIPLIAAAWLHRWEIPLQSLEREVLAHPEGPSAVLRASLYWPAPLLVTQVWCGFARLAAVWRMRDQERFTRVFDEAMGRMVAIQVHLHGVPAARILVEMFLGGVEADVIDRLQHLVVALLDRTTEATRAELSRWFDADVSGAHAVATEVATDETLVAEAMRTDDRERLAELACCDQLFVARAALPRIEEPRHLVARVRMGAVGFGRHVAERLLALADPETLDALLGEDVDPSLRFAMGMARLPDEPGVWPRLAAAICAPTSRRWFLDEDLAAIRDAGVLEHRIGCDLATSDQLAAYAEAVRILVESEMDGEVRDALLAFLDQGTERLAAVRTSAARRLFACGERRAFPLALTAALDAWERLAPGVQAGPFASLNPQCAEEAATCVVTAGRSGATRRLLDELERMSPMDNQEALTAILAQAETKEIQERALRALSRDLSSEGRVRRLAEIFAWGAKESRLLVGSAYRVHLIGGDAYGYTRLEEKSIYVNPMAFLRGHRDGEGVLRGLILHELGHHMFHADKPALKIWKDAEREQRHSLLNLVADEHLERNLRARRTEHGDYLKTLAAHAFQHQRRAVDVMELAQRLGPHTFAVLSAARLEVARSPAQVEVALGVLFREMERSGTSFVRFVRALRMGLGDRYGDPKVKEALALFDKSFRRSSMEELWSITKKLIEIFGEEAKLIEVLDLHDNANGTGSGVEGDARARRGVDDEAVQREVDRILDGDKTKPKHGERTINRSEDESFDEIRDIQRVTAEPEQHRDGVRRVARAARRLREVLKVLGLQLEPRRARLKGRKVDRAGLPRAIVRRDPRMLVAREAVQRADLSLSVLIDCSGSMSLDQNLEKAKLFGLLIAEACRGLRGVDATFWGFSDVSIFDAGSAERCAVSGLTLQGGNNDAGALWHVAQVGRRSTRRAKVLVMISDGSPTECSVAALRALVRKLERRYGYVCAQVAVRRLDEECFTHHVDLIDDDLDRAVRRFSKVVSRLVRQALSGA